MRKLCAWDEEYGPEDSISILCDLALIHAREVPGTVGETLRAKISERDVSWLCGWTPPYDGSLGVSALIEARQAVAFFSKSEWLRVPGVDPEAAAWAKYQQAEQRCRETNEAFSAWARGGFQFRPRVEAVLHAAQRKIAKVLGPLPSLEQLGPRFGPGATTSITKRAASWRSKLSAPLTCSESFAPYVGRFLEQMPHFLDLHASWETDLTGGMLDLRGSVPVLLEAGTLSFVPKKPTVLRGVTPQPLLNSMYQLGLGDYMSERLCRFGLDLSQQGMNQRLARLGSLTGEIATLDLVSASDTQATQLVWHLLPYEWAQTLDYACQRRVRYNGMEWQEEKFSGMGNGFTFPLESLIFWALATSCDSSPYVSVFGDDITCHVRAVPLLTEVLDACGFWVNTEKSYWSGSFRESCGKDYFNGIDIRPYYQKTLVSAESLFTLHNFYVRHFRQDMAEYVRSKYLCSDIQIFGPDGYGDGHLLGDWSPKPHGRDMGWSGFLFDTFTWKPKRDFRPAVGDRVLPLYAVYVRDPVGTGPKGLGLCGSHPAAPLEPEPAALALPPSPKRYVWEDGEWVKLPEPSPSKAARLLKQSTRIGVSLPGKQGYKRVSIYTLRPGA